MYSGIEGYRAYKKTAVQYMRPYEMDESLTGVDIPTGVIPEIGGMIAINVNDATDKWYITKEFVDANYELADT